MPRMSHEMTCLTVSRRDHIVKAATSVFDARQKNGFLTPQTSVIFIFFVDLKEKCKMVRSGGLEPPRVLPHSDLNAARLPIPPRPQFIRLASSAVIDDPVCDAKRGIRLLGILPAPRYPSAWLNGSSQAG